MSNLESYSCVCSEIRWCTFNSIQIHANATKTITSMLSDNATEGTLRKYGPEVQLVGVIAAKVEEAVMAIDSNLN